MIYWSNNCVQKFKNSFKVILFYLYKEKLDIYFGIVELEDDILVMCAIFVLFCVDHITNVYCDVIEVCIKQIILPVYSMKMNLLIYKVL